jgi:3-methyladenine DNA glycosylase AlkD
MTAVEIVDQLRPLGSDSYKRILMNHGIREPVLGVKIEELKKHQKRIKKDYQLAKDLYATGIYDAMYLAGLVADESRMTKKDLNGWLAGANCDALCGSVVAWITAESEHGWELALEWIDSKKPQTAATGWATLSGVIALRDDSELDVAMLKKLLQRVEKTIHDDQPEKVRYNMNGFVIALATYVAPLHDAAVKAAKAIGVVTCDMGDTACKVPFAPDYIEKARARGNIGKKRKTVRC